jgi:hypothetical protein
LIFDVGFVPTSKIKISCSQQRDGADWFSLKVDRFFVVVISSQKEKDEEISRRKRIAELTKRHLKFKKK